MAASIQKRLRALQDTHITLLTIKLFDVVLRMPQRNKMRLPGLGASFFLLLSIFRRVLVMCFWNEYLLLKHEYHSSETSVSTFLGYYPFMCVSASTLLSLLSSIACVCFDTFGLNPSIAFDTLSRLPW